MKFWYWNVCIKVVNFSAGESKKKLSKHSYLRKRLSPLRTYFIKPEIIQFYVLYNKQLHNLAPNVRIDTFFLHETDRISLNCFWYLTCYFVYQKVHQSLNLQATPYCPDTHNWAICPITVCCSLFIVYRVK